MSQKTLDVLVEMARSRCHAILFYRKVVKESSLPRVVETYGFGEGLEDTLIRCYQVSHCGDESQHGWRSFMLHKIDTVEPTNRVYVPRATITLPGEKPDRKGVKSPNWTPGRQAYRDFVGDALADGGLSKEELIALNALRATHNITLDDIRFVHASIYQKTLASITRDGKVNESEREQIAFMHRAFKHLGWGVGE